MFTKTRQEELMRTHCRSGRQTAAVNSGRPNCADRRLLNTLDTRNFATVKPVSLSLSLLTANKRARTTDSDNTVATRMFTEFVCKQDLVASQAMWNDRIWTKYSKHSIHQTGLMFKLWSGKRQDVMITKAVYCLLTTISKQLAERSRRKCKLSRRQQQSIAKSYRPTINNQD